MQAGKCASGDHHALVVTNVMVFRKAKKSDPQTFGWDRGYIIQFANGRTRWDCRFDRELSWPA
jgi:hypothetical protein